MRHFHPDRPTSGPARIEGLEHTARRGLTPAGIVLLCVLCFAAGYACALAVAARVCGRHGLSQPAALTSQLARP